MACSAKHVQASTGESEMNTKNSEQYVQIIRREAAAQRALAQAFDKAVAIFGSARLAATLSERVAVTA